MAQLVVVVQVLIAKRNPKHPLPNQSHDLVLDQILLSHIVKACCEPTHHPNRTIRLAQEQRASIRGHGAPVESSHHFAALHGCKSEQIWGTLCLHRGLLESPESRCRTTTFADSGPRCTQVG